MRMPGFHLVGYGAGYILNVEQAGFFCDLAMEDYLQQEVSKLLLQIVIIVSIDCVAYFVSFLDGVWSNRRKRLRAIPFATG